MSNSTTPPRDELLALLELKLCGEATADQLSRIEAILASHPELFTEYLQRIHLHVCLIGRFCKLPTSFPPPPVTERSGANDAHERASLPPPPTGRRGRLPWNWLGLAAASVLLMIGLGRQFRPMPRHEAPIASMVEIAQELDVAWEDDPHEVGTGAQATRFRFKSGLVELRHVTGVSVVVQGPADYEVIAANRAKLHHGKVVATVPGSATGFTIETPSAHVIDLGTEFGVQVDVSDRGSSTTIQVYRGEVVADARTQPAPHTEQRKLIAGEAVILGQDRVVSAPVAIAFKEDRFIRKFPSPVELRRQTGHFGLPHNVPQIHELRIRRAPRPVKIDGDFSDWDLSAEFQGACDKPFDETYHVRGAMMYDEHGVYIRGVIGDPDPLRNQYGDKDENVWRGGAVQIRLSTDTALGWPVDAHNDTKTRRPQDCNPKLHHITMWYSNPLKRACLHIAHGMDHHGQQVNPPGYEGVMKPEADGRGYHLEYFVPWTLLNVKEGERPPSAGDTTAVTWTVLWSYEDGRTFRGQWMDLISSKNKGWTFQKAKIWAKAYWLDKD